MKKVSLIFLSFLLFAGCTNPLSYKVTKDKRYIKAYHFMSYVSSNQVTEAWQKISITTKMLLSFNSLKSNIEQLRKDGYDDMNNIQPLNYYYGNYDANSNYYKYTFGLKGENKEQPQHVFSLVMAMNNYEVIEVVGYKYTVNDSTFFETGSVLDNLSEPVEVGIIK